MLEPETLRAFVAIAEQGHFLRAADHLGVAQSVVSKRLKRLEDQLGMRLVDRGKKARVALTREGELFLPEARASLVALQRTERLGRKFARGEAGPVRIGFVFSSILTGVLPGIIRTLNKAFPDIEVQPALMETPEQIAALEDGRIDFALVRPRPSYPGWMRASTIHSEDIVIALNCRNPLAQRERLPAREIVSSRLIIPQFHEEVGLIEIIRGIAISCSAPMPDLVRTSDFVTAAGLAAADVGMAVAPRSLARLALEDLCFRDISDYAARIDLVLLSRADVLHSQHALLVDASK